MKIRCERSREECPQGRLMKVTWLLPTSLVSQNRDTVKWVGGFKTMRFRAPVLHTWHIPLTCCHCRHGTRCRGRKCMKKVEFERKEKYTLTVSFIAVCTSELWISICICVPSCHQVRDCLGSEQALAPVRFLDSFAEGAWDKLPKTEGTFNFPSQTTIAFSFYEIFIGLSLYLKEYKPIFYKLKYEAELNLFSQHVVSQLQHNCMQYTAVDTSNTDRFPSFFFANHGRI